MTNDLNDSASIEKISNEYGKHNTEELYKSVMNIIIRANKEKFEEVKGMCEALRELFADELEQSRYEGIQEGVHKGIRSLILSCQELGGSWDTISHMIVDNFSVTNEQAEEYMKLYWQK